MMRHKIVYSFIAVAVVAVLIAISVQAPAGSRNDPLPAFKFRVEIDGIVQANFREVSGLACETDVIEYRDGSDPNVVRLLPGVSQCGPIVLKGGLTTSSEL